MKMREKIKLNMETIFNFDWLNEIESIYTDANTREPEMTLARFDYPIRLSTSAYTGYIVTIKDLDTDEIMSFNCDKIDLDPNVIDKTYLAMRNRFAIINNEVPYPRKNIKFLSVTVPKEVYQELMNKYSPNENKSLLWRIWELASGKESK